MPKFHLSHLPEVKAAIAAAGACRSVEELNAAIHAFEASALAASTRALPGRAGVRMPGGRPVMVLGKAPAATETETGEHFTGPAGQVLRDAFYGAGYDLEACWISSASMWRPRKDNTPNASQLAFSRPFLFKEIQLVEPEVVLCLGEKALEALTQIAAPLGDKVGTATTIVVAGRTVPVRILHNNGYLAYGVKERVPGFQRHLAEAAAEHPEAFARIETQSVLAA